MNILLTLDYELFFGQSGSPEKCIIEPTNRLLSIAEEFQFKCVFFVDAGYLLALKRSFAEYPNLKKDYEIVSNQIKHLSLLGHEIQLHIHTHWEDSVYDGSSWKFDLSRFRIDSFGATEIDSIFRKYKDELEKVSGKQVFVFRAGGWCIQPFHFFVRPFIENGIKIDSTVYYKGKNLTPTQWYNFQNAPNKSDWRFDDDPCEEIETGRFREIPISSIKVSPFFYWAFAFKKVFGSPKDKSFGDGFSSKASLYHQLRLLFSPSYSVVSMDGYKSSLLFKAYRNHRQKHFVVIGHPKAFTEGSLEKLRTFISRIKLEGDRIITYSELLNEQ